MKLDVIKIEQGYVVVTSLEHQRMYDWYIDDANQIRQVLVEDDEYWESRRHYTKILYTDNTFKLEGVPQFELEDDNEAHNFAYTQSLFSNKEMQNISYYNLRLGYESAQSKYQYTEEDLRKAFEAGKHFGEIETLFNHTDSITREQYEATFHVDEYIQSLKQPKAKNIVITGYFNNTLSIDVYFDYKKDKYQLDGVIRISFGDIIEQQFIDNEN